MSQKHPSSVSFTLITLCHPPARQPGQVVSHGTVTSYVVRPGSTVPQVFAPARKSTPASPSTCYSVPQQQHALFSLPIKWSLNPAVEIYKNGKKSQQKQEGHPSVFKTVVSLKPFSVSVNCD